MYAGSVSLVVAAFLVISGPAAAAPKAIRGKLNRPGYSVMAVAPNGEAKTVRAKPRFKLRPPTRRVTLHLRARNGTYRGPIVVGRARRGRRAILGVPAGAKLGRIKVDRRRGYARAKRVRRRWRDTKVWARARRGVPIGAGKVGFVRSKRRRGAVPGDLDTDGVSNGLDVDANGNLILDRYEHGRRAGAAEVTDDDVPRLSPAMLLTLENTVNANAAALSEADIDLALSQFGFLWSPEGAPRPEIDTELDCGGRPDPAVPGGWIGGLSYCTRGGTGRLTSRGQTPLGSGPPRTWPEIFPDCCDSDGDGFGNPFDGGSYLSHGATTREIGTGDVLNWRIMEDGVETQFPRTLQDVIATVPAVVSYRDGAGNAGTISYPVPPRDGGNPQPGEPLGPEVAACPAAAPAPCVDGHVVLTFTFWRPQRKAIGNEEGTWTDIGGLAYAPVPAAPLSIPICPDDAVSTTDPNLSPAPEQGPLRTMAYRDAAPDRPANPANTLTLSVDVTRCLDHSGQGETWDIGENQTVWIAGGLGNELPEGTSGVVQVLQFFRAG